MRDEKTTAGSPDTAAPPRSRAGVVGGLGVAAAVMGAVMLQRSRVVRRRQPEDRRTMWMAYLRDHLAGADAAIQVVTHLLRQCNDPREEALFTSLSTQFREDRGVVLALLKDVGASAWSVKRVAGRATGSVLKTVAGGRPGRLSLFRTLEGLALGVQGKRCLWLAARELEPSLRAPGPRSFAELESRAVTQWEEIERLRRILARETFP